MGQAALAVIDSGHKLAIVHRAVRHGQAALAPGFTVLKSTFIHAAALAGQHPVAAFAVTLGACSPAIRLKP